jgi:RecB family exonuclease
VNETAAPIAAARSAPLPTRESYSSLSTYEACPRRYACRYVERLPAEVPTWWFTFGSAVHRAFEAFDRARIAARQDGSPSPGFGVLEHSFSKAVDASGCGPEEVARYRARGEPVLRAFLERESASEAEPIAVELGFGIDIRFAGDEPTVRFVGYIDRIDRRPDGAIEIVDHKTGSPRCQADTDRDRQLTAYAFAGARGGLRDPANGSVLPSPTRLGLHFAEPGTTVWTTRSAAELEAFEARLTETVRAIRRREFAARPGQACRWCEYRATCPDVAP